MTEEKAEKAIRVPMTLLDRANALVPHLQATAWGDAVKWSEASLVRLALSRGLDALEKELSSPVLKGRRPTHKSSPRAKAPTSKSRSTR